jgi:glutathione S-transferase
MERAKQARLMQTSQTQSSEIILHGTELSGHCHRVELLLRMLELPYRVVAAPAEVRASAQFRRLNPLQQIPVLQDGNLTIADSNAILVYLAKRYAPQGQWLPNDPWAAAQVQRWLSIAAGELRYGPALARLLTLWKNPADPARAKKTAAGLLSFMEQHLSSRLFLAAEYATIADLACYSYVAHASEGGIALDEFAAVRAWLTRVEALPHFKAMPTSPIPAAG